LSDCPALVAPESSGAARDVELLVRSLKLNLAQKASHRHLGHRRCQEVDSRQNSDRPQLWGSPLAPRTAALRRRPVVRGLDRGAHFSPARVPRCLLDANQLFYRPISDDETSTEEKSAGILLFSA